MWNEKQTQRQIDIRAMEICHAIAVNEHAEFLRKLRYLSVYLKRRRELNDLDGYAELLYRIVTNHDTQADWTSFHFFYELRNDIFMNTDQSRELMNQALKLSIEQSNLGITNDLISFTRLKNTSLMVTIKEVENLLLREQNDIIRSLVQNNCKLVFFVEDLPNMQNEAMSMGFYGGDSTPKDNRSQTTRKSSFFGGMFKIGSRNQISRQSVQSMSLRGSIYQNYEGGDKEDENSITDMESQFNQIMSERPKGEEAKSEMTDDDLPE